MHIVIDNLWISTRLPSCLMAAACEANKLLMSWKWRMVMRSMLCFTKLVTQALDVVNCVKIGTLVLEHKDERDLGLHLLQFAEVVEEACTNLLPNVVCEYLYKLSEIFSKFYSNPECKVIGSDKETSRLRLCEAISVVMRKCFNLLGITPIYKI
ncbi:arginine--tRNA ligase, chloroplastic/mitochondrial isoform X1 [Gossypium raimondii]|uniref:arginine--tRNA ligase n=2 Tax=Gossypium raimondii TaxID=29730 RepID=A0A0D2SHA5_GOSRA|nr:arginine--tRNA ligase, chloroplastic/mitochondrial isoform X1 [Gossypium raimondii]XP_012490104.1 arginine--tRNA ligase, chloroplastic/mitochondrial isoform X1 [Gossypium raimondii]KJB41316.1 hypothetical protein B456_007G107900 [Gossypium raimondii]KJB41317.1 hypothetical protein B456_007G107900 [Gossypium raimondii]